MKKLPKPVADRVPIYRIRFFMLPVGHSAGWLRQHGVNPASVEEPEAGTLGSCQMVSLKSGAEAICMYLPSKYDSSTVIHECIHAAHAVLDYVGIDVSPEEDEALAYLVEWLVKQVRSSFYKHKVDFYK